MTFVHQRLHSHRLTGTPFKRASDVVEWLGAVQAQDYAAAKWALAQRSEGLAESAIDRAFDDGEILRTHVLRPTWHLVLPGDIAWLLDVTAPRIRQINAYQEKQAELTPAILKKTRSVLRKALRGGNFLERKQVAEVLEKAGVVDAEKGLRFAYIMMDAELEGIVCSGPRRGKQFTYALLDERAPNARSLPRDAALKELAVRFFQSHGPATTADLANWATLTVKDATRAAELASTSLTRDVENGRELWSAPSSAPRVSSGTVHLLPIYDEYLIGYKDRAGIVHPDHPLDRALTFTNWIFVDGRMAGTWKRTIAGKRVLVDVETFERPATPLKRAIAERVAGFKTWCEAGLTSTERPARRATRA